ncbi:MAG TPA: ABC transporter substrate-binding protein, partial [Acidimicrobiales bacterium]|nr:ABC transporter substrate-binding protein [Acidimicrobiales bacterium]
MVRARRCLTVLACAVSLLSAACGGDGGGGGGDEAAEEKVVPAAVQELVVGYNKDPWVDSAEGDRKRIANYPLNADVCQTLVEMSPDFEVVGRLASKWEHVGDNVFRFTLRDGATFSDGTPVTAEAVKYSLDYTVAKPSTSGFAFLGPESVTVVDEKTVDVKPTRPNLRLIEQIT